jgi:hypothetical protein
VECGVFPDDIQLYSLYSDYSVGVEASQGDISMPRYLVERSFPDGFAIPITDEGVQTCLTVAGNNALVGVTWLHSYVTSDKKKIFCIYEAPSHEAIRSAADRNNLPVDRITEIRVLDPYFYR